MSRLIAVLEAAFLAAAVLAAGPLGVRAQTASSSSETREAEQLASRALGRPLDYALYLPPGYGAAGARFPTVYLLHGVDGNRHEWLHDGHLRETLDTLIAAGTVAPVIVVMPDAGNSWYVDSRGVDGPGDYATAIGDELPAHIEKAFAARGGRGGRAIAGLSMGGFGALRLAFRQPFRYVAAASFSGAFWARLTPDSTLGPWVDRIFKGAFGSPFSARRFLDQSPLGMIDQLAAAKDPPPVMLTVGDDDRYKLYQDSFALFQHMREVGLPVEMRMTDGDHDWETWAAELPEVLRFFDARFKTAE